MAKLQIKYRLEGKALPPRPIKAVIPGWSGSPELKKENGSEPQPWHCAAFMEGCTHGVELLYQYDTECHVINDKGKVQIQWDRSKEPGGLTGPSDFTLSLPFPPRDYLFATSIDLQPPPGYVVQVEPHPRFFTDHTGTVPAALYGHLHGEWWPKKIFIVFKVPEPGQVHIFRKGEPYAKVLFIPVDEYQLQPMTPDEATGRRQLEENITTAKSLIGKNVWNSASGIEFNDHYKVLQRAYERGGMAGMESTVNDALARLEASVPSGRTAKQYLEIAKRLQAENYRIEAKEALHRVLRLNPKSAEAYNQLSHMEYDIGLTEVAIRAMRKAVSLEPKNLLYLRNLAEILRRAGKYEEAQKACSAALVIQPNDPQTLTALAFTMGRRGLFAEGLENCQKAMELSPKMPDPHFVIGLILSWQNRHDEARAKFETALSLDPNFDPARQALGELEAIKNPPAPPG